MKPLIAPLWESPPPEAPDLLKDAHRLMLRTLKRIEKDVGEVLAYPADVGGERVMDAAAAALLNPRDPPELRAAALRLLQKRMARVDSRTPQRIYSLHATHQSTISPTAGDELEALREFEVALRGYLLRSRTGIHAAPRDRAGLHEALLALGLLEALLVTRLGYCSMPLLGNIVPLLGKPLCVAGPWAWLDIALIQARNPSQMRRVFLDPATVAAWILASSRGDELPKPDDGTKAGKRKTFEATIARRAFRTLVDRMESAGYRSPIRDLRPLCRAKAQFLRVTTMPLLATFAEGDVISSSLEPGTWARLLGYQAAPSGPPESKPDDGISSLAADEVDEAPTPLPADVIRGDDESLAEQTMRGDLDEDGVIAKLRTIMRGDRSTWRAGFDALIKELDRGRNRDEVAQYVVCWLRHLAFERQNKGRILREGSIRNYRGLIVNRLLLHLPRDLHNVDEEELFDAYTEIINSRSSDGQIDRITAALASFDHYVRSTHVKGLPQVRMTGFGRGNYAISSRIISEQEFQLGLEMVHSGRLGTKTDLLKQQTEAFWILGYRFGMRRQEILGLMVRDLAGSFVRVRKNEHRELKTPNARRVLPLDAITHSEKKVIQSLAADRGLEEFAFFAKRPSRKDLESHPAVSKINSLLERVSGDRHLHPHNLRHSTATMFIFGSLGSDLGLEAHPHLLPWMKASFEHAKLMESIIVGELHRKGGRGSALAMTMGHGSELTTYEHYVHCLDLLLFMTCTQRIPERRRGREGETQGSDAALVTALLGYSPSTRPRAAGVEPLLALIARRCRGHLVVLSKRTEALEETFPASDDVPKPPPLQVLRELAIAKHLRGWPQDQSELDCANSVLDRFLSLPEENHEMLQSILRRWKEAQMKGDDWASMKAEDARKWIADLAGLQASIDVEVLHVTRSGRSKKIKTTLAQPMRLDSYKDARGRYWLRFAYAPVRRRQRRRKTKQERSRNQATITWLTDALLLAPTIGQQLNMFLKPMRECSMRGQLPSRMSNQR